MSEQDLQRSVANFLNAQERHRKTFTWFHPNTYSPNRIVGGIMKGLGCRAGMPDCVIFTDKRTVSVELKYKRGRVEKPQHIFHEKLRSLGHPVYVVRSDNPHDAVNQVEKILQAEGVL